MFERERDPNLARGTCNTRGMVINFRSSLKNVFATCLFFVSPANAKKNKNSNTFVDFSQTLRLSRYKELTNCSCFNATLLAVLKHSWQFFARFLYVASVYQ